MSAQRESRRGSRSKARLRAVEFLYQNDVRRRALDVGLEDAGLVPFAAELAAGCATHQTDLDAVVGEHSEEWRVERMSVVDRNILRVAAFELVHTDTPSEVVIDEAVELAKLLSSERAPKFVNGILGGILKSRQPVD